VQNIFSNLVVLLNRNLNFPIESICNNDDDEDEEDDEQVQEDGDKGKK
jgi:hypothetical protein